MRKMFPQERMSSLGFPHFAIKKKKTIVENFFYGERIKSFIFFFVHIALKYFLFHYAFGESERKKRTPKGFSGSEICLL